MSVSLVIIHKTNWRLLLHKQGKQWPRNSSSMRWILCLASLLLVPHLKSVLYMGHLRKEDKPRTHSHKLKNTPMSPKRGVEGGGGWDLTLFPELQCCQRCKLPADAVTSALWSLWYPSHFTHYQSAEWWERADPLSSDMGRWQPVLELVQSGWRDHVSRLAVWGSEISMWVTLWLKVTDIVLWPRAT